MTYPTDPSQLSPRFVTDLLRSLGAITVACVEDVALQPLAHAPRGIQVVRMRLSYDLAEAGSPRTLIALFACADRAAHSMHHALGHYAQVVSFVSASDSEGPTCLMAHLDPARGDMTVVLEDPIWRASACDAVFEHLAQVFRSPLMLRTG